MLPYYGCTDCPGGPVWTWFLSPLPHPGLVVPEFPAAKAVVATVITATTKTETATNARKFSVIRLDHLLSYEWFSTVYISNVFMLTNVTTAKKKLT
jgi:hypothetical protein